MKQPRRSGGKPGRTTGARIIAALWWVVATLVLATPIVISPSGKDMFRLPKELLFRGGWIALLTLLIVGLMNGRSLWRREDLRGPAVWIPLACVAWTLLATIASTNRRVSAEALLVVSGCVIFFLVSLKMLRDRSLRVLALVLVPAFLNALVAGIQEWTAWRPIEMQELGYDRHLMTTGLMGNPNDVGTLLMGPILVALAGSFVTRGKPRLLMSGTLLILLAGLLASQTLTAIVATAAGVLAMTALVSWKRATAGAAALAIAGALLLTLYTPLAERSRQLRELISTGDYNALLTNRLISFYAAAEMFRTHPILGAGPGTFGWHYFDYKLIVEERHPELTRSEREARWAFNFGEVHNDHLELAAEAGLPAWLLFMVALGYLASRSVTRSRAEPDDNRESLARLLALPLAVAFFVLTLAQFPLQLAGTLTTYLFLAAICVAWRSADV